MSITFGGHSCTRTSDLLWAKALKVLLLELFTVADVRDFAIMSVTLQ